MAVLGVGMGMVADGDTGASWEQAPFTSEASARGINYITVAEPGAGRGVAFADLDGDGDPDIVLTGRSDGLAGFFENDGTGCFLDRSLTSGLAPMGMHSGVVAGDYDGDGDLDLFFSNWIGGMVLARNDGSFSFANVTAAAALTDSGYGTGCAWGDYDSDGWLDLYMSTLYWPPAFPSPSRLFHNIGNGSFESVDMAISPPNNALTWGCVFFDFDRDGDSDLYISNDKGQNQNCVRHNYLYENANGVFVDITESSGTAACIDSMGVAVGDFDRNGFSDLYCTNIPWGNPLFLNLGDGAFTEFSQGAGVQSLAKGWGTMFFDYDNDGELDLYVCNQNAANRLYRHGGAFPCMNVAPFLGVNVPFGSYCTASADIDDDGDLDFMVQGANAPVALFINHEGQLRRWAKFDVVAPTPNRFSVGAVVEVRVGNVRRIREVLAGSNYKSQDDLTIHFGLDQAMMMDDIHVLWTGGITRSVANLPTNRTWTLYHPDLLADADQDGDCDADDLQAFAGCFTGPDLGRLVPGCEMMDVDGDGDVDVDDLELLLKKYTGPIDDCNRNGMIDLVDVVVGSSLDANGDLVPDECRAIPGDLDGDGVVGGADLGILLLAWGPCGSMCTMDFTFDGAVDGADLGLLLLNWSD